MARGKNSQEYLRHRREKKQERRGLARSYLDSRQRRLDAYRERERLQEEDQEEFARKRTRR